MNNSYMSRGVSATKSEVHEAIKNQSAGIFPGAFCKIIADPCGDDNYCALMHADGAGTKSSLAYLYYKETGDESVFEGIAQDSIVMNLDDLLCVGAVGGFVMSNTIGRNAHRISGSIIKRIIEGYASFIEKMRSYGIDIEMSGGETADVGDLVSTLIVDSTFFARLKKSAVVDCANIRPGELIIGLSSTGKAIYESEENMSMGSNGLTAARHLLLSSVYRQKYPETFSDTITDKAYCGKFTVDEILPHTNMPVGRAILSPTRTYAPVIKAVLDKHFDSVDGMIHCTGGGQVKCKNFGRGLTYIKDNLFETPALFKAISEQGEISPREMYNDFNMGHRMELYVKPESAGDIIKISESFGVEAKIIGRVEESDGANKVIIKTADGEYTY